MAGLDLPAMPNPQNFAQSALWRAGYQNSAPSPFSSAWGGDVGLEMGREAVRGQPSPALPLPASPWNATKVPFNPGHGYRGPAAPETLPVGSIPLGNPYGLPKAIPAPAAPNQTHMGVPSAVPGAPHPLDYATWYASKLAENGQGPAPAAPAGSNEISFLGPNSPRMVAPATPAPTPTVMGAGRVIHPGTAGGPAAGGGPNLLQTQITMPLQEAALRARLDPSVRAKQILATEAARQYDAHIALNRAIQSGNKKDEADARNAMVEFNTEAYRNMIANNRLAANYGLTPAELEQMGKLDLGH